MMRLLLKILYWGEGVREEPLGLHLRAHALKVAAASDEAHRASQEARLAQDAKDRAITDETRTRMIETNHRLRLKKEGRL